MSRSRRADPQAREPLAHLALDPLRAAAEVADPRRAAGRTARRERPGAAAVVAAERRAGLVVDERPFAVRAGLDVPQSRHRTTDAVPRRFMTRIARSPAAVSRPPAPPQRARTAARGCPRRAPPGGRRPRPPAPSAGALGRTRAGSGPAARGPRTRPTASRTRGRPPRRPAARARARRRAPGSAACGRSCRPGRAPRRRRSGRRRRAARGAPSRVPTTRSTSPARMRRHSSARSPSPRPEWTSAIRTGRSARRRSTIGVARAISGRGASAGRPASSDAAMAST